jgi:hypothetical protein
MAGRGYSAGLSRMRPHNPVKKTGLKSAFNSVEVRLLRNIQ